MLTKMLLIIIIIIVLTRITIVITIITRYCRTKLTPKEVHNTQYIAAMNPSAGSFTVNPRLQRHFATFAVVFPSEQALFSIYNTIVSDHLKNSTNKFKLAVQKVGEKVVDAAIALHLCCAQFFNPSGANFHYIFNLRDLSNVFAGLLFSSPDCVKTPEDLTRLWVHETSRVYRDKLSDSKDLDTFDKAQKDLLRKKFEVMDEAEILRKPLIFCHFAKGIAEAKYMPVSSWDSLHTLLKDALKGYNELNPAMDLVLFEDAMSHICKINRAIESPRANLLLVGVGGSGKQSLSRLAAFISSMEVFQMTLRKGYGIQDMMKDLAALYMKTGVKNIGIVFLMSDAQVRSWIHRKSLTFKLLGGG